jgi:hypothetical protein
MSLTKICIYFYPQRFRPFILLKIILLIIITSLCIICIIFINKKDQLCDPTQHLDWFCSWPDPKTTVCTWDEHFPIKTDPTR